MFKNVFAKRERRALITGITGQDGSYMAEFLLDRGYEVHGIVRRASSINTERIGHLYQENEDFESQISLHYGDITDGASLTRLLSDVQPHEIYHLAAQSHVGTSFDIPEYTADVTGLGTLRLLDAMRDSGIEARFYQASSSEMFGKAPPAQSEATPFAPCSPYAVSKLFAYWTTVNYRESYGMFAANGILFNHESPRRGDNFVTRKVTRAVARILAGKDRYLYLGNLEARRDWGYAPEYVEAMWMMLQQPEPDDFVIATGESHSVRELVDEAFSLVGLNWQDYVRHDERYVRPSEVCHLLGDPTKARQELGWQARTSFQGLVRIMLQSDLAAELGCEKAATYLARARVLAS
ncbi:MAG TPA: GDP-mannose 4,6-dehydratase [Dehalococcoidia bacterium]|nr:GDP-mannose 4,6-dehydratase [Dehalococcoidia bacterium]